MVVPTGLDSRLCGRSEKCDPRKKNTAMSHWPGVLYYSATCIINKNNTKNMFLFTKFIINSDEDFCLIIPKLIDKNMWCKLGLSMV